MYRDIAYDQSKGRRSQRRRDVRRTLGTSSDPAPEAQATVRAAYELGELLYEATGGLLKLKFETRAGEVVSFSEALRLVRVAQGRDPDGR